MEEKCHNERIQEPYFHSLLQPFNDELYKYDVAIGSGDKHAKSDRELKFEELKHEIENVIIETYPDHKKILVIRKQNWDKKDDIFACINYFLVEFHHNSYASQAIVSFFETLSSKMVNVSKNCKVIDMIDAKEPFIDVITKINQHKRQMQGGKYE